MAAGIQTTGNGEIKREQAAPLTLMQQLNKLGPQLARALPKHVNEQRMLRVAMTALSANPKLGQCTPTSFFGCMLQAAQLGLEVNTPLGQAYLIPRKNRSGVEECTLMIGFQGFQDLARRTGEVANIYAEAVYPDDVFEYELGLERKLRHVPSGKEHPKETELTHAYAVVKLKGGEALFVVLTKAQIEKYRKRGASGNNIKTPWDTDYEAMAKKTAFRRLFTWIPKSAEMATAAALDEAPEVGKLQISSFDANVVGALEEQGLPIEVQSEEESSGSEAS